jgi:hypothetical protein
MTLIAGIGPLSAKAKIFNECKLMDITMMKVDYSPLGCAMWWIFSKPEY